MLDRLTSSRPIALSFPSHPPISNATPSAVSTFLEKARSSPIFRFAPKIADMGIASLEKSEYNKEDLL